MDTLLSYKFLQAHRAITKYMNEVFKPSRELTITQLYALWAVDANSGNNLTYIAKKMCMDRTTLFRTIDRMDDLVDLGRSLNQRNLAPSLTHKGLSLIKHFKEIVEERDKELTLDVTKGKELDLILKFLNTVERKIGYSSSPDENFN